VAGRPAQPEPRWGFHRLTDQWADRIVRAAGVRPGELVLDVGAGHGALTAALVDAGARVIAVELHPSRIRVLRERFADDPVRIVRADAADVRLPTRPFRVVANPPYGVTTALVRRLLSRGSALYAADLLLPRGYVRRVEDGASARSWAIARGLTVPRGAFRPAAPRDTVVLVVRRGGSRVAGRRRH
jgi:23S rRNA (adenine-N6)-dimethyltransferase